MTPYQSRSYRNQIHGSGLTAFNVIVKETDLQIHAEEKLEAPARKQVLEARGYIESYIQQYPGFAAALTPWKVKPPAPQIIRDMGQAGINAGVGPMAAVAGAVAEHVGRALLSCSKAVIVENGGDIFLKIDQPLTMGIYAGQSPLSMRIGLKFKAAPLPFAVCTSSGTIGHSLSHGKADAVCTVSHSCALADAAATAIGNIVKDGTDIAEAIEFGKRIDGISGIVVIIKDQMGLWGDLEIVRLAGKR